MASAEPLPLEPLFKAAAISRWLRTEAAKQKRTTQQGQLISMAFAELAYKMEACPQACADVAEWLPGGTIPANFWVEKVRQTRAERRAKGQKAKQANEEKARRETQNLKKKRQRNKIKDKAKKAGPEAEEARLKRQREERWYHRHR